MSKRIFLLSLISLSLALFVPFACAENISDASAKSPTVDDYEGTWIMNSPEDVKSLRWDGQNPNTQKFTIVTIFCRRPNASQNPLPKNRHFG